MVSDNKAVSEDEFNEVFKKVKKFPAWESNKQKKFYYLAKRSRYVFLAELLPYAEKLWPNNSMKEVVNIESFPVEWSVVKVLKQPLVVERAVRPGDNVDIYIPSGYFFSDKFGKGGYEIVLDGKAYLGEFRQSIFELEDKYRKGELTYKEKMVERRRIESSHESSDYAGVDYFYEDIDIKSYLNGRNALCDLPFLKDGERYVVFLSGQIDGAFNRVLGVSVLPYAMLDDVEEALKFLKERGG